MTQIELPHPPGRLVDEEAAVSRQSRDLALGHRRPFHPTVHLSVVAVAVSLVFAFPFVWMVLSSFKSSADIFRYATPLTWWTFFPPQPTLASYAAIFGDSYAFQRSLLNSLIAACGQVIGTTLVCSVAAFVFARMHFPGRDKLFALVLVTAFVPLEVTVVPLYVVMRTLNLTTSTTFVCV